MKLNFVRALLLPLATVVALGGCGNNEQAAAPEQGPAEVDVVTLRQSDVTLTTELPGRTHALRTAEIRPQVNGIITRRYFREGAEIQAGEQLYQIDDAPYRAAYATAQAQLAQANANVTVARSREQRLKGLLNSKSISQQDYDEALASYLQAEAAVKAAEAAIETARINLQYTRVLAPINGRIGKSAFTEGALVTAGQSQPLAVIQQYDPIYVDVSQSVTQLLDIRRQILKGSLQADQEMLVRLQLTDGSQYEHDGRLEFSEVDVNESTGTVIMRAQFPNPDHLLLPGMFVRAEITEAQRPDSVLIPQRAVTHDREGNAITMVVNDDGVVEQRQLHTGRAVGDQWLVLDGVEAGEQVIVSGLQRVRPGAVVKAVPADNANQAGAAAAQAVDAAGGR